jgi:hypothetical protein
MSSSESTETLIRNPKESAVIFGCVVVLAVVLEFVFSYFRHHRSSYIGGLFGQLSEETMIVGCISLIFVFVVQSFPNLPDSWVIIFRWAQGVIFFMIVFFVVGVAWTAVISRILCVMIQKFEFRLLEALTRRQNTDVCDMLRRHWQILEEDHGSREELSSANLELLHSLEEAKEPESVQDGLHRLLRRRVSDLGQLRQEFGAMAEISDRPQLGDKEQRQRTKQVEEFLGDAALRLQDYFLEGSQFTTGGLRDPEPVSALQSTLLVLRRVFLHQVRSKQYLPAPLHALIIATERLRLTAYILDLESDRRELMAHWQAKRMTLQSHSAETARLRAAEALTYEDLLSQRRRTVNDMVASRGRAPSAATDIEALHTTSIKRDDDLLESLKESARVVAASYVAQRAETWISDGCIDPEVLCRYVPFSKYLYKRMRTTIIAFVDITWQCWISLVVISSINSARLYMLPGKLQSKAELETSDYRNEMFSFIFLIGYTPMIVFLVAFMMLMRNFRWYLRSVKVLKLSTFSTTDEGNGAAGAAVLERRVSMAPSSGDGADELSEADISKNKKKRVGASVWLPPDQLAGQLAGDLYEDPSRYLLRGNKSFTLHTLKIPALLIHFYFSMFVVKLWNTGGLGAELVGYVVLGVIPVIVVFGLLPIALFAYTSLMSLGLRVEDLLVYFTAARQCRRVGGKRSGASTEGDSTDHDDEIATLVAPLASLKRASAGASGEAENDADNDLAAKSLARRVLGFVPPEMQGHSSPVVHDGSRTAGDGRSAMDLGVDTSTIIAGTDSATEIASTIRSGAPSNVTAAVADRTVAAMRALEQKVLQLTLQKDALEELLSTSTGMRRVGGAANNQKFVPQSELSLTGRASKASASMGTSVQSMSREEGGASPDSSSTRELLEYYKGLLMEQGSVVKALKEQVRGLEATHRGGVLHPNFYRPDSNFRTGIISDSYPTPHAVATTAPPPALPHLPEAVLAARAMGGEARAVAHQSLTSSAPPRRHISSSSRTGLDPVQRAIDRNHSIL